jgi:hypothetical protein
MSLWVMEDLAAMDLSVTPFLFFGKFAAGVKEVFDRFK